MSISGKQTINVGVQNQATGSDSLYEAFTKTEQNFTQLFACASPYNTFTSNGGINVTANANTGIVSITNTGVTKITAGTGITINQSNGNVIISASGPVSAPLAYSSLLGDGPLGEALYGVTNVGVTSSTLNVTGSPIVSEGIIDIELPDTGVLADTYIAPTITVDRFGRITAAANTTSVGTVTSVEVSAGDGISVTGGPITDSGNIVVTNTGVTKLVAGSGIELSSSTGEITIAANIPQVSGTVIRVGVTSNSLAVTGSPVVLDGNINVEMPTDITAETFISNVATGTAPFTVESETEVANLNAQYANVVTNPAQPTITSLGNLVALTVNGNITAGNVAGGNLITANYFTGTLVTGNQPNISNIGTLGNLTVTGNVGAANVNVSNELSVVGNVTGGNLISLGDSTVTGNLDVTGTINVSSDLVVGNLTINDSFDVVGNLSGGNLNSVSEITAGGNIEAAGNIFAALNITTDGDMVAGNFTTGGKYYGGGDIQTTAGNLIVAGTGNITGNLYVGGQTTLIGNAVAGNLTVSGGLILGGNITGNNLASNGNVTAVGNISGGNLIISTGNIIYTPRYGSFYSNVTQTNPVANTAMAMTFNNTFHANGVSVVSGSQLTIPKAGTYNIQFSAVASKTGGGTSNVDIWLSKNGTNVDWTNTQLPITASVPQVLAWNFVETANAGDYFQLMWSSADTAISLSAIAPQAGPTRPGTPSVIVTVTPVGA